MCVIATNHVKITESELVCLRCGAIKIFELGRWITAIKSLGRYLSSAIELGGAFPSQRAEEISTLIKQKKFTNDMLRNNERIIFWIEDPTFWVVLGIICVCFLLAILWIYPIS